MALNVTLASGGTTYRLRAESVIFQVRRPVINQALPGNVNPLLLDLGQKQPLVSIEANIPDADATEDAVTIPGFLIVVNTIFGTWWNTTITLTFPSGHSVTVKPESLRMEMKAENTTYWQAILNFVISAVAS